MRNPSKPPIALAWVGDPKLVESAWGAMIRTEGLSGLPQEILHHPPIFGVESELWNYRFYCCANKGSELAYMRVNASRPAGILWFLDLLYPLHSTLEEEFLLYYAGQLKTPCAVFLVNTKYQPEEHDNIERELRERLLDFGMAADEAPFIYGVEDLSAPATWPTAIQRLYQRLDESLAIPEEQQIFGRSISCSSVRLALFSPLEPKIFKKGASLCLVFNRGNVFAWLSEAPKPTKLEHGWYFTADFTFLGKSDLYLDNLCHIVTADEAKEIQQSYSIDYRKASGYSKASGYVLCPL